MPCRTPVQSSVLRWFEFDPVRSTLKVEFVATGEVYRYRGVSPARVEGLLQAESKGRYFNAHIRDRYPFDHL